MTFVLQFTDQNLERDLQRMFENSKYGLESFQNSWQGAASKVDAIGEKQLKRTQSGSSSQSRRNLEAVEADTIGEQQLCTESCPAPDYSCRRTRGEVAERAKRAKLLVCIMSL